MEKTITVRLPGTVFSALQSRAEILDSTPTAVVRQLVVDGINREATEARILAAIEGAQKQEKEHATAILKVLTLMQQLKK